MILFGRVHARVQILVFFLLRYNFVRNQLKATQLLVQRERDVHYNELQNLQVTSCCSVCLAGCRADDQLTTFCLPYPLLARVQHLVKKQARMLEAQRQAAGGI